jgi:hypothetical protein
VRNGADSFYARRLSVLHGEKKGGGVRPSGGEAGGLERVGKGNSGGSTPAMARLAVGRHNSGARARREVMSFWAGPR